MRKQTPRAISFSVYGPIRRDDVAGLCARVCALFERERPAIARCDVAGVGCDVVTIEALARLQLAAKRYECLVHLRNASSDLRALVAFLGLRDVLPDD